MNQLWHTNKSATKLRILVLARALGRYQGFISVQTRCSAIAERPRCRVRY